MDNQFTGNGTYRVLVLGPDGSTVSEYSCWPDKNLSDAQKGNIQGEFIDVSNEQDLNNLANGIAEGIEEHYNQFISESPETVVSKEGGQEELQEAGVGSGDRSNRS